MKVVESLRLLSPWEDGPTLLLRHILKGYDFVPACS